MNDNNEETVPVRPVDAIFPGAKRVESIEKRCCVKPPFGCGQPVGEFRDALSEKEYRISGLCQKCQDEIFGE